MRLAGGEAAVQLPPLVATAGRHRLMKRTLRTLSGDYYQWVPPGDPTRTLHWRQPGGTSGAWELECLDVRIRPRSEWWVPEVAGWSPEPQPAEVRVQLPEAERVVATELPGETYRKVHEYLARQQGTDLIDGRWWFPRHGKYLDIHHALCRHFRLKRLPAKDVATFLFGTAVWERHGAAALTHAAQLRDFMRNRRRFMQLELLEMALRRRLSLTELVEGGVICILNDDENGMRCEWLRQKHHLKPPNPHCIAVHYRCVDGMRSRTFMWIQWYGGVAEQRLTGMRRSHLRQCLHGFHSTETTCKHLALLKLCIDGAEPDELRSLLRYTSMLRLWRDGRVRIVPDDGSAAGIRRYLAECDSSARWMLSVLGLVLVSVEPILPGRWVGKRCSCTGLHMEIGSHQDCTFMESNQFAESCTLRHHPRMVSIRDITEYIREDVFREFPLLSHRRL